MTGSNGIEQVLVRVRPEYYYDDMMKTENINTQTKVRPTPAEHLNILMLYARQKAYANSAVRQTEGEMCSFNIQEYTVSFAGWTFGIAEADHVSVEVKPLESISDDEIKEIGVKVGWPVDMLVITHYANVVCLKAPGFLLWLGDREHQMNNINQPAVDELRARGFALAYKNWSVADLVEFGIFKLTSNEK